MIIQREDKFPFAPKIQRQVTPLTLQKKKEDCREGEDFKGSLRPLSTKLMFATSLEEQREHRSRTGEKK